MADSAQRILTGVKHVYFTPWVAGSDGTLAPSTSNRLELLSLIADSVAISQDDPETNQIDSETRDEPIIESITLGKYTVTMDSADINFDILTACLGFVAVGTDAAAAPAAYIKLYGVIEVEMDNTKLILPKALLSSKIDASSLKTNVCKGTISGTGYSASVTVGSNTAVNTPFIAVAKGTSGFPTVTIANIASGS